MTLPEVREGGELISFSRPADLAGVEVLSAAHSRRLWRWHHTTVSICTPFKFEGTATYQYRRRLHTASPAALCVMEPGEVHVTRTLTAPATFRVLFVPDSEVERAAVEAGVRSGPVHFSDSVVLGPKLVKSFQRLHASLEFSLSTPMERQERFASSLRLLLQATQRRRTPVQADHGGPRQWRRAREFLDEYSAAPVGLDDVATAAGVSRFALVRLSIKELGVPPHAYKLLRQVGMARTFLQDGADLRTVAEMAGFFDVSHLIRHFKRVLGVTPGAYLRGIGVAGPRRSDGTVTARRKSNPVKPEGGAAGVRFSRRRGAHP